MLLALTLVTACGDSDDSSAELSGTSWELVDESLDVAVPDEAMVTIEFTEDTVSGSSGCNSYTGSYTQDDDSIEIGALASTRKACVPEVAVVEDAFYVRIGTVTTVEVDGDELNLLDSSEEVVLTFSSTS